MYAYYLEDNKCEASRSSNSLLCDKKIVEPDIKVLGTVEDPEQQDEDYESAKSGLFQRLEEGDINTMLAFAFCLRGEVRLIFGPAYNS